MVKAVVGANWGDEGKGKITDMLGKEADIIVRFQGGANAGHTIVNDYGKFALHTLPSGVFYDHTTSIIGNGVALDIPRLFGEVQQIVKQGVPQPKLLVSDRAQIVMSYHKNFDAYEEERLGGKSFGSTKSGIMVILTIRSVTLTGSSEGLRFFLVPDFERMAKNGIGNVIFGAMSQAFFTLSIGMGGMAIFGSYLDKKRSLAGESLSIVLLDTCVALMAGLIVIPSCFAFGVEPDAGPGLVFITLPNIFTQMAGGRIWGSLFFLFLFCAALSTIVGVFENIVSFWMDLFGWKRTKAVGINILLITVLSIPCILGFSVWSGFQPLGAGTNIMDLEDFIVSNNILPLGSVVYLLFCTHKNGWGWKNFIQEANSGDGLKFPAKARFYMTHILPWVVVVIYLKGYYDMFRPQGTTIFVIWMLIALGCLGFIAYISSSRKKQKKS